MKYFTSIIEHLIFDEYLRHIFTNKGKINIYIYKYK